MTQPTDRQPAIDLTRYQFKRDLGDLSIYGTWLWNDDQEAHEPALVVLSRYRPRGFKPCVVALSAAFKYDDPRYLAHVASEFVTILGIEDSMSTAHRVASLIADHLEDLLTMRPNPTDTIVVADATIGSGSSRRSLEIVEYVSQKA